MNGDSPGLHGATAAEGRGWRDMGGQQKSPEREMCKGPLEKEVMTCSKKEKRLSGLENRKPGEVLMQ